MKGTKTSGDSVAKSMIYKTLERYAVMAFQMIVQIVIARLLSPSDYGVISMMIVFIAIATIFVQNGFSQALVQKKEVSEIDYSTTFILNLMIGVLLYVVLLFSTPYIAEYYHEEQIKQCLPVMSLLLIFGSINSTQIAIANRQMRFKKLFYCNVWASILSGIAGIVMAVLGFGVWALVTQQLSNSIVLSVTIWLHQRWFPKTGFSRTNAKELFSFGWKLLVAGLLNQTYKELTSLIIGRKYTSSDLAFYTKGSQFPKYITMGVDSSINSVMYAAFSKNQNNKAALYQQMKNSMVINTYIVFPLLALLALMATPLVHILLTDKWLPVVPYMQICCFTFALHPIASVQVQAITAVGRSDIRLKIEILKKTIGVFLICLALPYGSFAIAISVAIAGIIGVLIGAIAGSMTTGYKFINIFRDLVPTTLATLAMMMPVYFLGKLNESPLIILAIQGSVGAVIYIALSAIFKLYGYNYLVNYLISNKKVKK